MREAIFEFIMGALPEILAAIAWPFSAIVIVCLTKKDLSKAFNRLVKARFAGTELEFGQLPVDSMGPGTPESQVEKGQCEIAEKDSPLRKEKVGNIYWLANDLMWTVGIMLRNAPISSVHHGLDQTNYHLKEAGLDDSDPGRAISEIRESIRNKSSLTLSDRKDLASRLTRAGYSLGDLVAVNQEDFKSSRSGFRKLQKSRDQQSGT